MQANFQERRAVFPEPSSRESHISPEALAARSPSEVRSVLAQAVRRTSHGLDLQGKEKRHRTKAGGMTTKFSFFLTFGRKVWTSWRAKRRVKLGYASPTD